MRCVGIMRNGHAIFDSVYVRSTLTACANPDGFAPAHRRCRGPSACTCKQSQGTAGRTRFSFCRGPAGTAHTYALMVNARSKPASAGKAMARLPVEARSKWTDAGRRNYSLGKSPVQVDGRWRSGTERSTTKRSYQICAQKSSLRAPRRAAEARVHPFTEFCIIVIFSGTEADFPRVPVQLGVIHFDRRAIAFDKKWGFEDTGLIVARHKIPRRLMVRPSRH